MMVDEHESENEAVAAALRALPREMAPPSHVAAVLARSVPRRRSATAAWRVAVAASLVVAAFAAGRLTAPNGAAAIPAGQEFAFLLYGGASGGGDARAAEYGDWARALAREGRAISGERLGDAAWLAGTTRADPAPLRGFFIVQARDAAEALELARRHPHARDGTVVVRPIDTP
jgi:hypothetical protein